MQHSGYGRARDSLSCARSNLLAVCAFCWLVSTLTGAWALDVGDGVALSAVPQSLLSYESLAAAVPGESGSADRLLKEAPILGGVQFSPGKIKQVRLNAFSYAGKTSPRTLGLTPALGLWSGTLAQQPIGRSLGLTPIVAAAEDRATSLKGEYGGGPAKLSVDFSDVGAKFPAAAPALQGTDPASVEALKEQAGLRSLNLSGALQLGPRLSLTSTSTSLTNNKPGDEKRGLTTTDWAHALALSLGQHSNIKLSLTDHGETWDPAAGKTDLTRRTSQLAWDTSFGRGGVNSLKLGLTEVSTAQGGQEQSERTEELHLALAPLARLKLSADQVAKDAQGNTQATSSYGAVMQLAPGAELAANLKTTAPEGGAETRERYLKLTTGLGAGASALTLLGEQKLTQTTGAAMIEEAKYDLTGGLGRGPGRVNLHGLFQQKRTEGMEGPVEGTTLLHLDRAFGPRLKLSVDREHVVKGTKGQPDETSGLKLALAADLDPKTKLVAGASSQQNGTTGPQSTRDLGLERRVGQMVLRAEDHQRTSVEQTSTRSYGADLPMGKLADWAADMGRKHEFGEIYDFLVTKEAAWLDLPFSGLRYLHRQRRNGLDDGVGTTIVSYRTMVAQRYHLQVTYHDRPESEEDGDKKGRPMELTRRHVGVGALVARGLFARGWLTLEDKATDALSARSTLGLGLCGKVHGDGRMEMNYAQDRGQWEGQVVARDSVAVMYAHRVSDERQIALKIGYAWGENLGNGRGADCRVSIQYNKPV